MVECAAQFLRDNGCTDDLWAWKSIREIFGVSEGFRSSEKCLTKLRVAEERDA